MKIDTSNAIRSLRSLHAKLSESEMNLAIARGINRAVAKGKTQTSREIRSVFNIKAKDVNQALTTSKASRTKLEGAVIANSQPMPLAYFAPRQTKTGVSVSVRKGERKLIQRAFFLPSTRYVFARGQYHTGEFQFRTKRINRNGSDLPVNKLRTTSPAHALKDKNVLNRLSPELQTYFLQRLEHEINYLISKL